MFLLYPRSISSIRGELVPYLVRKQFSKTVNSQKLKDDTDDQTQEKNDGPANHGYCLHSHNISSRSESEEEQHLTTQA